MIEENALVARVEGDAAEVVTQRRSACGSCAASGGCGTSLLAAWFPQRQLRFTLHNSIGARAGDSVVVGLDEAYLQRGAMLLYAVPLLGLLLGAVAGEQLAATSSVHAELGAVGGGLLGLFGALAWVRRQTARGPGRVDGAVRLLRFAQPACERISSTSVVDLAARPRKQE